MMVLKLALEIQQTGLYLENERNVDIFFPPVSLDSYQSACLEMEFAAFAYFEVKLAYASPANNAYKERQLFRSIESLGRVSVSDEFLLWKTTVTPDMTESQAFVVVLHSKSSSLGTMARIDKIKLLMQACNTTGENVHFLLPLSGNLCFYAPVCAQFVCLMLPVSKIAQKVMERFL